MPNAFPTTGSNILESTNLWKSKCGNLQIKQELCQNDCKYKIENAGNFRQMQLSLCLEGLFKVYPKSGMTPHVWSFASLPFIPRYHQYRYLELPLECGLNKQAICLLFRNVSSMDKHVKGKGTLNIGFPCPSNWNPAYAGHSQHMVVAYLIILS